ncbi:hypothetical protein RRG08_059067 [Elysia crispata]|uniref:G-protein coupled receptors family 1 profile domain-containing protein n=1 Tax=Elysia crispata TaxID=231223 RepID=A0AAE1B862_9GAST|nr:hypothetical protein RRG08_059067 [Elysia crispata]
MPGDPNYPQYVHGEANYPQSLPGNCDSSLKSCLKTHASPQPMPVVDCGLHFQRVSPKCVMVRDALGEVIGCRDLRHLMGCENFTCPDGYIKCPRSYCIPQGYMADGRDDCLRGEDEYKIERPDVSKHFLCSERNNQSVSIGGLCDGRQDCDRGEDEIDCDYIHIPGTISLAGAAAMFSFHRGQEAPKVENQTNFLAAIDERTRYLDLTGVHVPEFFQNFPEGRLRQLIVLILSNCGIHDVFRHARDIPGFCEHHFRIRDMNALRKIDLSHNNIKELPECSHFKLMKGLKHLNLSHNPNLSNLTRISFTDMSSLEELDISYIGVSELPTDLFDDLPNLQKLWIRGLRLDSFDAILPEKITYLNLEHIRVKMEAGIFQNIKDMREMRTSTFVRCCPTILAESNGSRIPPNNCHAPTDTLSSCTDLLRDTFQRSLLWTFGILAIVGNLLTVTYRVLWDRVTLMKPTGMFVTNLSISDLIIGVYLALISTADRALKGHYIQVENWWRDSVICRYLGLLANVASITSAWFILLLTVDQVQIIRYPRSKIRFSTRTASLAVLGTWLFGLAAVTPPMIAGVTDWEILGMNSMCLGLGFDSERVTGWSYAIAVYVFIIGGLYMATLIGQYSIYGLSRSTGRRFRRKMRLEKRETVERRILELSMARRVSRISMTNFLSFAGISLIDVMVWRGDKVSRLLYAWTLVLIFPINSALNPILYFYPILSKALDKIQIKSKLKKAAAKLSETTGSKKTNPLTAATSLDDDDDDDIDDLFMPYDDNELLELCCEDLELLQYILEDEMVGEGSDDSDSEEITREDIERLQTELRQLEAKLAEILNKSFENSESEDMNKCEENSEDEEMNKCLEYSQSEDMNKCEEKREDKEIKKCLEYSQSEEMNKCLEYSQSEKMNKCLEYSQSEEMNKCLEYSQSKEMNKCLEYSQSEDMNKCLKYSQSEEMNKCLEYSQSEKMNKCLEYSQSEEMNKCLEYSQSEKMNKCLEYSQSEEMNKCLEYSQSEEMNKCLEYSQSEEMNKCEEKSEDEEIKKFKKKSEDEDLKKCLEYSESEDMNECEENSEDKEMNKCQEKSESEDMNECEENSEDEEINKCQEKSESEDMNECEENSEDEEMNKCQEKSESEDMNECEENSEDEEMNKCQEKSESEDMNKFKEKSQDEKMNKCKEKGESEDMNKFKEKSQDEDMNKCKEKGEDGDINNRKKK